MSDKFEFEDFGKKAKEVGQKIKEGAVTLSESAVAKTKLEITKHDLINAYAELGEAYYDDNPEESPTEYADMFDRIATLKEVMEQHKEKIRKVKNTEICPFCGAEVAKGNAYCGKCGGKMPEEAEDDDTVEDDGENPDPDAEEDPKDAEDSEK